MSQQIGDLLQQRIRADPNAKAAVDLDGRSLRFAELDAASAELAAKLDGPPASAGMVVAALPNCIEAMISVFAVFRSRHTLALLHPELPACVREATLERLRPCAELTLDGSSVRVIDAPYGPSKPMWQPPARLSEFGIALCVLTSGSTGQPRAIVAPHRQVLAAVELISRRLGYRPDDVVAVVPPLSFDYGLYQLLLSVAVGAAALLDPRLASVQGVTHAIARAGVTVLPVVPTMLRAITAAPIVRRLNTDRVRLVTTTGDVLTERDVEAAQECFPNALVLPMYGLSECKRVAISPQWAERPHGSVGLPLDDADVAVANRITKRLGPNVTGELVVSGPHLTLGYLNDPDATALRFPVDPQSSIRLLRSGDRLRQDADGWLYWSGRGTDLIKTSGFRLDPAELETAAATSDMVLESGAYGRADSVRGQVPVLVVRLRYGADPASARAALSETFRRLVPRWATPELDIRFESLPRTHNGKIDRAALGPAGAGAGFTAHDGDSAPEVPFRPLGTLWALPVTRQFINCHTQAFLSAYAIPYVLTPVEFELLTTVPFGVRCVSDDPHRLLVPHLDPDVGLDRACDLLELRVETVLRQPCDGQEAIAMLEDWLKTGPVVLGPLDLGALAYHELAETLHGCDHYVVALGLADGGNFIVRDPEGFVQVRVEKDTLLQAWAKTGVPEGRGAFMMRRLILDETAGRLPPGELPRRLGALVLENLVLAEEEPTGGSGAYRALSKLAFDATERRSLSLLLPSTSYRYRAAACLAQSVLADAAEADARVGWNSLATLFREQAGTLAIAHRGVLDSRHFPLSVLEEAASREEEIAARATALRRLVDK